MSGKAYWDRVAGHVSRDGQGTPITRPLPLPSDVLSATVDDLAEWWRQRAQTEIQRTVPKAIEYGAHDLVEIGRTLARCMNRQVSDEEMAELGIYFYLVGKVARWTDAVTRGDRPSDDTLFDIGVYIRMAQRVRAAGGWPGTEKA